MSDPHLSQTELANRWRMSPRTLERWRFTGEGPQFIKLPEDLNPPHATGHHRPRCGWRGKDNLRR